MKKVKREIMRRYHPDKHNVNNNNDQDSQIIEEINEICRIANIIFESAV